MARKRANGEGSLTSFKRNVNGKTYDVWRYRFPDGRQVQAKTQKEVLAKRDAILKEDSSLTPEKDKRKIIFADFMKSWLKTKKNVIKQKTYEAYEINIRSLIENFSDYDIGHMQLGSLTDEIFNDYYMALAKKNYSLATLTKIKMLITQALRPLVRKRILDLNIEDIKLPSSQYITKEEKKINVLNDKDIEKFVVACNEFRKYGMNSYVLLFLLYSGLRTGECLALTWDDIDYEKNVIHINKTVFLMKGKPVVGTPKTKSSNRTIPLTNPLREILEDVKSDNKLVFHTSEGNYIEHTNVRKVLNRIIKKGGYSVDKLCPHELRHTYVSMLLAKGVAIETVSKLVGHNNITITSRVYHQLLDEQKIKEVEFMKDISIKKGTS